MIKAAIAEACPFSAGLKSTDGLVALHFSFISAKITQIKEVSKSLQPFLFIKPQEQDENTLFRWEKL